MYNFDREERVNRERLRRLASWYKGRKEGPSQIDVELHKRCNERCIFCARYDEHERLNKESINNEMPVEKWLQLIDEISELGGLIFNIEGINEPPAVPELFFPVIDKVKEVGLYGIVTTNGTLWSEQQLKHLVEIGWDRIHFSIQSPKESVHDALTGLKGSFKKAIRSIHQLNKWKRKLCSERPMLNINICINRLNFKELPKMVKLAHSLNAAYLFTEPLMVYTEAGKKLKLNREETKELQLIIQKAKLLAEKYEIDNNFATQDRNLEEEIVQSTSEMRPLLAQEVKSSNEKFISAPCFKPWENMAIRYNGFTGWCGFVENGENVKEKSLKEIWFGKLFEKARGMMLKKRLFSHCYKCVPSDFTQRRRFRKNLMEWLKNERNN